MEGPSVVPDPRHRHRHSPSRPGYLQGSRPHGRREASKGRGWGRTGSEGDPHWGKTKNSAKSTLQPKRSPHPTLSCFDWTPPIRAFSLVVLSAVLWRSCVTVPFAGAKKQGSAGHRDSGPSVADSKASLLPSPGAHRE